MLLYFAALIEATSFILQILCIINVKRPFGFASELLGLTTAPQRQYKSRQIVASS